MYPVFIRFAEDGIQNLNCSGDPATIKQGRKSFPSGHSSFSFAVGIFTFLYLAGKWKVFASNRSHLSPIRTWRLLFLMSTILGKVPSERLALKSRNLPSNFSSVMFCHLQNVWLPPSLARCDCGYHFGYHPCYLYLLPTLPLFKPS